MMTKKYKNKIKGHGIKGQISKNVDEITHNFTCIRENLNQRHLNVWNYRFNKVGDLQPFLVSHASWGEGGGRVSSQT